MVYLQAVSSNESIHHGRGNEDWMLKVVLIDDEIVDLEGLHRLVPWKQFGMEVTGAFSKGSAALDYLRAHPVDLLVTDIHMPIMSGLTVAEEAQKSIPQLKVVFISGYADFRYAQKALRMKAANYVLKPVDNQELYEVLTAVAGQIREEAKRVRKAETEIGAKSHPEKNFRLIEEIERYVEEHLEEKITLKEAAQHFAFSPNYLGYLFKEATGENFSDFLIRKRIDLACKMLQDPRLKIYEIAERLGYASLPYFTRQFKQQIGISPGYFRKQS